MDDFFFCGSHQAKLDDKNRFVLPQSLRYGLIENGELAFSIGIGLGGCLSIYRRSEIKKLVQKLRSKMHIVKYQRFFTLFFSTLHHTTCDKIGRLLLPPILKKAAKIESEIVIAGVLNKIEVWAQERYESELTNYFENDEALLAMSQEIFSSEKFSEEKTVTASLSNERPSLAGLSTGDVKDIL